MNPPVNSCRNIPLLLRNKSKTFSYILPEVRVGKNRPLNKQNRLSAMSKFHQPTTRYQTPVLSAPHCINSSRKEGGGDIEQTNKLPPPHWEMKTVHIGRLQAVENANECVFYERSASTTIVIDCQFR